MSAASALGAAAFLLAAGALPAAAMLAPRPGQPVAILHRVADGGAAAEAVARAGGELLKMEGGRVTVALSEQAGFASRLQLSGAWLVLDAAALNACEPASRRASRLPHGIATPSL
jgi:hypothetical protein